MHKAEAGNSTGSIETSTRPQASNGSNGIHAVITYDSIHTSALDTNPGKIS